jgi:hypothetical protein
MKKIYLILAALALPLAPPAYAQRTSSPPGNNAPVQVFDSNGTAVDFTGIGGGTQYPVGGAATGTDTVTLAGCVRKDTAAVDAGVADGDRVNCATDSAGRLRTTAADTTQPVSAASLPLPSGAATAAKQPGLGTAGASSPDVISVQGIASGTALPVSGTVTGSGTFDFNLKQVNGTTVVEGQGLAASGSPRVTIARDSEICNPINTAQVAVAVSSSGNNELVAISGSTLIYICDLTLISDGTVGVQLIYGTGTACATGETNMSGVMSLVVNSGWTHNYNGRLKTIAGQAFCLELSGAVAVNGILTYRQL